MKKQRKILVISITSILFLTGMLGASAKLNGDPGGLTPGFWKNLNKHQIYWTDYDPYDTIEDVFDLPPELSSLDVTLIEALKFKGGNDTIGMARILLRSAVAAILNDAHPDMEYQYEGYVIGDVNAALASLDRGIMEDLKDQLDEANNYGFEF